MTRPGAGRPAVPADACSRGTAAYTASMFTYGYGMILASRALPSGRVVVTCEPAVTHAKADALELGQRVLAALRSQRRPVR